MKRKNILALDGLVVLGLVFLLSQVSFAQSLQPDRIAAPIAGSPAVWLEGNVRPMFQPENDLGPAAGSLKLENISLMFRLTASQQTDLTTLLTEQQDPTSPNYHHWLTPEQYADRFGLSTSDVNKVKAWLEAQGFQVTHIARGRSWVSFSGTAAQVQGAFQTEIHNFSLHGQTYFGNASEPAVPAAFADVVMGIRGLDNYRLKPRSRVRRVKAEPNFTSAISGNTFVAPGDFAIIYDVQSLYDAGIDGTGQTVAVMGQTDLYDNGSDVTSFRSAAGLSGGVLTLKLDPNSADPGVSANDIEEASLDVEWSGAVAKNATIIYFYSTYVVDLSLYDAIDTNLAPVISISYGECEASWGTAALKTLAANTERANSQGQTIVAAAGDSGAADCDSSSNPNTPVTVATQGLAVDAPASLPYVTGMGGSEFNEGLGTYWKTATSATGDIITSALSYIPEMAWNDTANAENTGNALLAGGGGASTFTPSGQPSKPTWQTGPGVPNDNARDVPDLSLNASPIHEALLICVEGSCTNGFRDSSEDLTVVGGTSAGAPTFAGIMALVNQKQVNTSPGWGNINSVLYPMAHNAPAAFHDIMVGNNKVPCEVIASDTGCPASGEMGFDAGPGYDQASGLGSVDAYNLVMEWGSTTVGLPAPTLTGPTNGATGVAVSPAFGWSAVSGNNGYRIFIATSPTDLTTHPAVSTCSACTLAETTNANSNSYTPATALAAGTYFWEVQAIEPDSSTGLAAWSEIFGFTTTGGTLSAPTLTAPANGTTTASVTPAFTWTSVAGNDGYRILISPLKSGLPTNPAVGTCGNCAAGATTTSATYTPTASALVGGTTYYWEVQALASSGSGQNGTWSNIFNFATPAGSFSLSASPTSLTIAPGGSGASTLTLTPINNFSATTNFSCNVSNTLAGVTCSVGILGTNNTATVTIDAASTAATYPTLPRRPLFGGWWIAGATLLCLLLLALFKLRPGSVEAPLSKLRYVALGAALATLLAASLSCGGSGGGGGGGGSTSPPPESGTVTVTGTSGSITQTTTISVSVS